MCKLLLDWLYYNWNKYTEVLFFFLRARVNCFPIFRTELIRGLPHSFYGHKPTESTSQLSDFLNQQQSYFIAVKDNKKPRSSALSAFIVSYIRRWFSSELLTIHAFWLACRVTFPSEDSCCSCWVIPQWATRLYILTGNRCWRSKITAAPDSGIISLSVFSGINPRLRYLLTITFPLLLSMTVLAWFIITARPVQRCASEV